jgi:1-phosphofructokinase/tagatose 6-phosphate kinase
MSPTESGLVTTVTLNAAIDRTLVVPSFQTGRRHRASKGVTLPGGRGVTIARALRLLGVPTIATGLAGGLTGATIVERLTDEGILNDFLRIAEPSRTSTAVIDPMSGEHTEINEYGPKVSEEELAQFQDKLRYLARASRAVVLAGSLPREVADDTYQKMVRMLHSLGDTLTVITGPDDTPTLTAALSAEPQLTVLEQREAEPVAGHEFSTDEDFILGMDAMGRMGARSLAILHDAGCYVRVRQGRDISYWKATHLNAEPVSPLGAADVFVAGYLSAYLDDRPFEDRLKLALGTVLANNSVLGPGLFEPGDAPRLAKDIQVEALAPVEEAVATE